MSHAKKTDDRLIFSIINDKKHLLMSYEEDKKQVLLISTILMR